MKRNTVRPSAARRFGLEAEVAHQRHAGVHAFRLARMDAVVVEEDRAPSRLICSRSNTPSALTTPAWIGTPASEQCRSPLKRSMCG
jgi:hypothetical protein